MSPSTASPKNHVFGANMVAQQANLPPSYTGVSYWCCFVSSNSTEPLFLSTHSSYFCFITIILKYLKIKILNVGTHFSTLHMFLACRRSAPPKKILLQCMCLVRGKCDALYHRFIVETVLVNSNLKV